MLELPLQARPAAFWHWTGKMAAQQAPYPENPSSSTSSWQGRWEQTAATGLSPPCLCQPPAPTVSCMAARSCAQHLGANGVAPPLKLVLLTLAETTISDQAKTPAPYGLQWLTGQLVADKLLYLVEGLQQLMRFTPRRQEEQEEQWRP